MLTYADVCYGAGAGMRVYSIPDSRLSETGCVRVWGGRGGGRRCGRGVCLLCVRECVVCVFLCVVCVCVGFVEENAEGGQGVRSASMQLPRHRPDQTRRDSMSTLNELRR